MPGIGEVTEQAMKTLNISTIGHLANISSRVLAELMGKNGKSLQERARGIDTTPLALYQRQKSLGSEHTFSEDVNDPAVLITTLKYLSARIGRDLRDKGLTAKTITLKIRDSRFNTTTRAAKCDYTNADHRIFDIAVQTFLRVHVQGTPLRLIGITTSDLIEDYEQTMIFAENQERLQRLYESLDWIRDRYGKYAVTYGSTLVLHEYEGGRGNRNAG
jgi:DNA polymerase-4